MLPFSQKNKIMSTIYLGVRNHYRDSAPPRIYTAKPMPLSFRMLHLGAGNQARNLEDAQRNSGRPHFSFETFRVPEFCSRFQQAEN